ncbi:MAG: hypothetical protein EA389_09045 [Ilumatobacter sp.]|nr:MAG: hypothetical protein EA389_09045 [Ilumatobacter sp.]
MAVALRRESPAPDRPRRPAIRRVDGRRVDGRRVEGRRPGRASVGAPKLTVVPARRRAAGFVATLSFLIVGLMLGAAVLHTMLAERQMHIDRLERSVAAAEDRFDVLRRQRAELRSPTRLATEARNLGMVPASVTEFVDVDPHTIAMAIAATGQPSTDGVRIQRAEPLDQFVLVKRVTNEAP